ncbi:amino acid carrier protein [Croceimicrobium hydrocarbonivorans]|uniref:Amino acid carrier protein n=1 Tax=Croceimicrobium hydrocarbonivorans TaxID=2761580 RepID=A0A7H0VGJ2_9FLAO|nr:amino acid carrier protein [Croceimicrobium hydrocarbonivorans]QNR24840.1 amino acid carrier protein [Croceimicrobium hydrocarbonivorans]
MRKGLVLLLSLISLGAIAQGNLKIDNFEISNPSSEINDGRASVSVSGGMAPYHFKWSNQGTDTLSRTSNGLVEGMSHSLIITDAAGNSIEQDFKIPSESIAESLNGTMKPVVDGIATVIFWDPFYALGLYDNRVINDDGVLAKHPNGDVRTNSIPFIVIWLIFGAIFFTIRMGFVNFWGWRHSIKLVRGKYDEEDAPGEVTHFQALATAVSATVGLGNIAGVAVAISVGGPGATFWLIVVGLLSMASKFTECTLGVKYRDIGEDGVVEGGPMRYLRKGLANKGMAGLGKTLAVVFAVLAIGASFGGGNMFQANQAFEILSGEFAFMEGKGSIFGFVLAILVGAVILGGIKSIAKVTEKIVPFMAGLYIIAALVIIFRNFGNIGEAFALIIDGAFKPSAMLGGFIGVMIQGVRRAAFSNEAGVGSAAIAHSAAKTKHAVSEGFVALLEPFIDTVVVCTLTALVLIFTGYYDDGGMGGAQLTSQAFGSVISWFPYVLVIAIFLFAFSTMISWSYYGLRAWTFLFGRSQMTEIIYKVIFCVFIIIGSSVSLGAVLDFSDMMILAMAFPNIIGLLLLSGEVRAELKDYWSKIKKGEILNTK